MTDNNNPMRFDAWTDALAMRHAEPITSVSRIGIVAFAALAAALGCPPDRVGDLYQQMLVRDLPTSAQEAVDVFRAEIQALPHLHGLPRSDEEA